jgi:hypothetical protein
MRYFFPKHLKLELLRQVKSLKQSVYFSLRTPKFQVLINKTQMFYLRLNQKFSKNRKAKRISKHPSMKKGLKELVK